jgi:hypothetical protein
VVVTRLAIVVTTLGVQASTVRDSTRGERDRDSLNDFVEWAHARPLL